MTKYQQKADGRAQKGGNLPFFSAPFRGKTNRKALISKYLFIVSITIIPLVQFAVFYIGVNINSLLLAFQEYHDGYFTFTAGMGNFREVITRLFEERALLYALRNSALTFLLNLCLTIPLCVVSAYFIWKKTPFSGFFKVVLMLPSMISSTVFCIIAKFFLETGLRRLLNDPNMFSLIYTPDTSFWTITFYDIWLTFAANLILYLGAMSAVSVDVVEYGKVDGMNAFQEFIHIVVPGIWPTLVVFLLQAIAQFFTAYGSRYTFYESPDRMPVQNYTIGYYFFVLIAKASTQVDYPFAAAAGILFTCVAVPVTFLAKHLLEKYGPRED